jgi:formate hydrogenlyase subunit 3/multisubunit Na+/H+ antiporter MnhD subunit
MVFGISLWWVLLAVVVYFGIGALWYSPVLFLKQWQAELKQKKAEMSTAAPSMVTAFLSILVLVLVEAYLVSLTGTQGFWSGSHLGFKLWLGFVATTALVNNVFQNGSKKLYAIDQGYHLVGIMLAGGILAYGFR